MHKTCGNRSEKLWMNSRKKCVQGFTSWYKKPTQDQTAVNNHTFSHICFALSTQTFAQKFSENYLCSMQGFTHNPQYLLLVSSFQKRSLLQ